MTLRIALLIKKAESVFSNGCIQQAFFLYKLLKNTGFDISLITPSIGYRQFELTDAPITEIAMISDLPYDMIIYTSAQVNDPLFIERCKQLKICLIDLICGNLHILHQEEYIFGVHHILQNSVKHMDMDAHWLLPMYSANRSYIEMLTQTPTIVTPYVWDHDIVDMYMKQEFPDYKFDLNTLQNDQVIFFVFEPNVSIHKTSQIPLLIIDEYYRRHPLAVYQVNHFCGIQAEKNAPSFFDRLLINKSKLLKNYPRMIMLYALLHEVKSSGKLPIVVTHHISNELNFLHLELMYLGVPVIHNCEPYKQNGLYYHDSDLNQAVDLCQTVRMEFKKGIQTYMNTSKHILERYSPNNQESIESYKKNIISAIQKLEGKRVPIEVFKKIIMMQNNNMVTPTPISRLLIQKNFAIAIHHCNNNLESTLKSIRCDMKDVVVYVFTKDKTIAKQMEDFEFNYGLEIIVSKNVWTLESIAMNENLRNANTVMYIHSGVVLLNPLSVYQELIVNNKGDICFWENIHVSKELIDIQKDLNAAKALSLNLSINVDISPKHYFDNIVIYRNAECRVLFHMLNRLHVNHRMNLLAYLAQVNQKRLLVVNEKSYVLIEHVAPSNPIIHGSYFMFNKTLTSHMYIHGKIPNSDRLKLGELLEGYIHLEHGRIVMNGNLSLKSNPNIPEFLCDT